VIVSEGIKKNTFQGRPNSSSCATAFTYAHLSMCCTTLSKGREHVEAGWGYTPQYYKLTMFILHPILIVYHSCSIQLYNNYNSPEPNS